MNANHDNDAKRAANQRDMSNSLRRIVRLVVPATVALAFAAAVGVAAGSVPDGNGAVGSQGAHRRYRRAGF